MGEETYLGDGAYATFDGYGISLRAPRDTGDHVIVLEPEVLGALLLFTATHLPPTQVERLARLLVIPETKEAVK
jgi:hypothetical protein